MRVSLVLLDIDRHHFPLACVIDHHDSAGLVQRLPKMVISEMFYDLDQQDDIEYSWRQ